jgi:hypothetical protein
MFFGLALIGAGLLWLTALHASSAYGSLWPAFVVVGAGSAA